MSPMSLNDAMFLLGESREHPMHVGGLQLFQPPPEAGPTYVADMYHDLISRGDGVTPALRRRAHRPLTSLGQWSWATDDDIDLEHHVRHSALPHPGRVRELLELTSRLHGTLLDRTRPLWEVHLISGLADGRFAVYTKVHHALVDGVSSLRWLNRALSTDPEVRDMAPPWEVSPFVSQAPEEARHLSALPGAIMRTGLDVAGIGPAAIRAGLRALREQDAARPFQAPKTLLNTSITGARRFAAQSWSMERVRLVRKATGATLNDVVLAMCAGALRNYLAELDGLPEDPLIAMVPVSLRTASNVDAGGNSVGAILCNLATDVADPTQRLAAISASMQQGKAGFAGLSTLQASAVSALAMSPLALNGLIGLHKFTRPVFNLVISNVPGPRRPLYWNGAHLVGCYPLSIPVEGQALNITVSSYAGSLEFGLTGCRRTVPHLQRLLGHLETSLLELEDAAGL